MYRCIYGCSDEGGEHRDWEERREWRLPGLLYVDDLVICGESKEDLRVMVGGFAEVFRRGLKINAGKSKVLVLSEEEGLECEVHVFKYLGYVLDEVGTDGAECSRKVANERIISYAIRSLDNARDLQLESASLA